MKRVLSIATLLLSIVTSVPSLAVPTVSVQRVGPETTSIGAGYRFELWVSGLSGLLGAFSLDLTFDPEVVGIAMAASRPPLGNVGASPPEAVFFSDASTPGILHIDEVSLLSSGELNNLQQSDSFEFARVGLTALGLGFTDIELTNVTLSDDLGNRLEDVQLIGSSLNVVPEPLSLLLVGVGLLSLGASARKRAKE